MKQKRRAQLTWRVEDIILPDLTTGESEHKVKLCLFTPVKKHGSIPRACTVHLDICYAFF